MNSVVSWGRAKSLLLFALCSLSKWTQVNQVLFKNVMHCILPISFVLFLVWCNFNKMWNTNLRKGYWILLYSISLTFKPNLTLWNGTLRVFTWTKLITLQAMRACYWGGGGDKVLYESLWDETDINKETSIFVTDDSLCRAWWDFKYQAGSMTR